MPFRLSMILLFIVFFFYSGKEAISQNGRKNKHLQAIKLPLIPTDLGYELTHPQTLGNATSLAKDSCNEILNYFIDRAKNATYLNLQVGSRNETKKVPLDSLLPEFKLRSIDFIERQKNKHYGDEEQYLKSNKTKNIIQKIWQEEKKPTAERTQAVIEEILSSISLLPDSKEKVGLFLSYAYLKIQNETYYNDTYAFCYASEKVAIAIQDSYERCEAYYKIGEFAYECGIKELAIQMYYYAQEAIENSSRDSLTKFNWQANIYDKLGVIYSTIDLAEAQSRAASYFRAAGSYFPTTRKADEINLSNFSETATNAYLLRDFPEYLSSYPMNYYELELPDLRMLKSWYSMLLKGATFSPEVNCLGFWSLGTFLRKEGKNKEALFYYIYALFWSALGNSKSELLQDINAISTTYAILGNERMTRKYDDLALYVSNNAGDRYNDCITYLHIARHQYLLKNYDSALVILNKIQFDSSLSKDMYPFYYNEILSRTIEDKSDVLAALKSDSLNEYLADVIDYKTDYLKSFTSLIETEYASYAESNYNKIEGLKTKLISLNKSITSLIGTIKRLKGDTAKLGELNRKYSDSLWKKQQIIRELDSIITSNEKRNKDLQSNLKEIEDSVGIYQNEAQTAKKVRDDAVYVIIALLFLSGLGVFLLSREIQKRVKQNNILKDENSLLSLQNESLLESNNSLEKAIKTKIEEAKRIAIENEENNFKLKLAKSQAEVEKIQAETKLFSALAINHDISRFIPCLPEAISGCNNDDEKKKLVEVTGKLEEYYLKILETNDSLTNTVKEEVLLAKISSEIYQYLSGNDCVPDIIANFNGNHQIENLEIPKHMLVGFVANSVKHGSDDIDKITVSINAEKKPFGYEFIVEDNGSGFESLDLDKRPPNRGINLILKQVKYFNENNEKFKIIFGPENVTNKVGDPGVIVKFKLITK